MAIMFRAAYACCVQVQLRRLMIDMVLGTDMKQHVTIISRFQTALQVKLHSCMMTTAGSTSSASAENVTVKFEDPADRSMLLQVTPHGHDIKHIGGCLFVCLPVCLSITLCLLCGCDYIRSQQELLSCSACPALCF